MEWEGSYPTGKSDTSAEELAKSPLGCLSKYWPHAFSGRKSLIVFR